MLATVLSLLSTIATILAIIVMVMNVVKSKSRIKILCGTSMIILSIGCGIKFGVYGVYNPDPSVTVHGIPIPVVIFENREGQMIDYAHARPIMYLSMFANAIIPAGIMATVWLLVWQCTRHITQRRHKPDPVDR